ncbi:MAG: carboxypeptidase-like regulatory domain-containing protein, partial [Planctomycetes bacterium]|nr:carboxypeptidase-like regulatory domain-containing protein [Planctomycetota bacterium]
RSWIFVFNHPHYQVTKANGHFSLDKIPPGEYMLEMVHPAGKLSWSQKIKVRPGRITSIDIVVSPDNRTEKRLRE